MSIRLKEGQGAESRDGRTASRAGRRAPGTSLLSPDVGVLVAASDHLAPIGFCPIFPTGIHVLVATTLHTVMAISVPLGRGIWYKLEDRSFRQMAAKDYNVYKVEVAEVRAKMEETGDWEHFEDSEFPSSSKSLYKSENPPEIFKEVEWKRIQDLCEKPCFMKEGGGVTNDFIQGELQRESSFLTAVVIMNSYGGIPKYLHQVLPPDQRISDKLGLYYARFWRFGTWVSVIVNDELPSRGGKLIYGRAIGSDEFWFPILQKAYASFLGSYEAICGGVIVESIEDLTGGLGVEYDLEEETPKNLFGRMLKAFKNGTFMICLYVKEYLKKERGTIEDNVTKETIRYIDAITGVRKIPYGGREVDLVRVRDKVGDLTWVGKWCNKSGRWSKVDVNVKKEIGYKEDGEDSWICFEDFVNYYTSVFLCMVGARPNEDGLAVEDKWNVTTVKGCWPGNIKEVVNYRKSPQYYMHLEEPDEFDPRLDDPSCKGKCSITIGLMQEDVRRTQHLGAKNASLSLRVYKLKSKPAVSVTHPAVLLTFEGAKEVFHTGFCDDREVTLSEELDPGHYVVIPTGLEIEGRREFLLRVFAERKVELVELE